MNLKRKYNVEGKLEYRYLVPDEVTETAICQLLSNEYPEYFELITQ